MEMFSQKRILVWVATVVLLEHCVLNIGIEMSYCPQYQTSLHSITVTLLKMLPLHPYWRIWSKYELSF